MCIVLAKCNQEMWADWIKPMVVTRNKGHGKNWSFSTLCCIKYTKHKIQPSRGGQKTMLRVFFYGGVGGKGGWVLVWGVKICQQAYLVLFNVILHQGLRSYRTRGLPKVYISVLFVCIFFFYPKILIFAKLQTLRGQMTWERRGSGVRGQEDR